jgi:hypothetical protein
VTKAAKVSGCIAVAGLLGIFVVMSKGFGPCGPDSPLGTYLLLGGAIALISGSISMAVALIWSAVRRQTAQSASGP